jgi:hypothetical protein
MVSAVPQPSAVGKDDLCAPMVLRGAANPTRSPQGEVDSDRVTLTTIPAGF